MKQKIGYNEEIEAKSVLASLAKEAGYKLIPKTHGVTVVQEPKNAKDLDKLKLSELRDRLLGVDESIEQRKVFIHNVKNQILTDLNKEGPTEYTRQLFAGRGVPINRVVIYDAKLQELLREQDYISNLIKVAQRKEISTKYHESGVVDVEIVQGTTSQTMKVTLE